MAKNPRSERIAGPGWAAILAIASLVVAPAFAGPPDLPVPPAVPIPPIPPVAGLPSVLGNYHLPEGETHEGKLKLLTGSAVIAGKQIGDVWILAGSLDVTGEVTGSIEFWGSDLKISGKVGKDVSMFGGSLGLTGSIGGLLDTKGGQIDLAKGSRIDGNARIRCGQATVRGEIRGDLDAACGQIAFGGTVAGDAELHADEITIEPDGKVSGDFVHESRVPLEEDSEAEDIVDRIAEAHPEVLVEVESDSTAGDRFGQWLGLTISATIFGLLALAVFRGPRDAVLASVAMDPLRNVGFGFLTIVVVPVALLLSCILLVTIPFAALLLVLFAFLVYVAQAPVAVWIGRFLLARMRRPDPSSYFALLVGMPVLYVLFALPLCFGPLSVFAALCLGTGAMVFGTREWWQNRKRARMAAAIPATPEPAPDPPVAPPPEDDLLSR